MILHNLISDHMVLQREKPIYIFGMGAGHIAVTFLGKTYEMTNYGGDFCLTLLPQPAGGPYEMQVDLDGEARTITDIMIGEVFLAGGQSNMQMKLSEVVPPRDGIADYPMVRYYNTQRPERGERLGASWTVAAKEIAPAMSALGWMFATKWAALRDVAVGIVTAYQGAANLQSFVERDVLMATPMGQHFSDHHAISQRIYPAWGEDGALYDFMIKRLAPYSMRAVLWYQGESNNSFEEATFFPQLMKLFVENFRKTFRDPTLPFVQVQIAPFGSGCAALGLIREAQMIASDITPGLATVTIGDIGEEAQIHPSHKEEIADRLVRAVRHTVFGETEIPYLGPMVHTVTYEGGTARITFTHTEGGLVTDGEIDNLYLLDEAGNKHLATCRLEGEMLVATAPIERAVGAELGMEVFSTMHLFNGEGLPAVQFKR